MHLDAAVDLFLVRRGHVERRDEPERAVASIRVRVRLEGGVGVGVRVWVWLRFS